MNRPKRSLRSRLRDALRTLHLQRCGWDRIKSSHMQVLIVGGTPVAREAVVSRFERPLPADYVRGVRHNIPWGLYDESEA